MEGAGFWKGFGEEQEVFWRDLGVGEEGTELWRGLGLGEVVTELWTGRGGRDVTEVLPWLLGDQTALDGPSGLLRRRDRLGVQGVGVLERLDGAGDSSFT